MKAPMESQEFAVHKTYKQGGEFAQSHSEHWTCLLSLHLAVRTHPAVRPSDAILMHADAIRKMGI